MAIKKPSGRKDVHLRFRDHAPMSPYHRKPIGKKTKSFVQERKTVGDPIGTYTAYPKQITTPYAESVRLSFARFETRGGRVYTGETYYTNTEKHRLQTAKRKRLNATKSA